ncbi:Hypothetical protein R9X50_00137300 [Acrodontium crateriforme]|uniref:Isopenicillin N synthase-like Fe(2+) 2OG dioxygenase domain-containing protein n=1 Tax=Acrodontium crateriforme TaxID=150365 RepID=A0AAQ3M090_9PEZI|nr:Hypothetical protein R9X50_00137300 [Acrodontium crateriforme]
MPQKEGSTEFTPNEYPPFPDDQCKTVELETISLKKLLEKNTVEEERAFTAFKTRGFVYLELGGTENGKTILKGSEDICRIGEQFFRLNQDEKIKYRLGNKELFGQVLQFPCASSILHCSLLTTIDSYKIAGATRTDKSGTPDTAEFMNVAKNEMIILDEQMRRPWPKVVTDSKQIFASYSRAAHTTGMHIMIMIMGKLGVDPNEITSRHVFEENAGDHVRITRGPPRDNSDLPEIQTPSHTDFGTITILMNWLGGLQVWSKSARKAGALEFMPDAEGEWLWVKPKRGCAIVNLGDAAVKFTNGVLCSGRHRVVPAPGDQGLWPRYSVVYFVRPTDHCKLKTLKGEGIPMADDTDEEGIEAKEWIFRQAINLGTQYLDN